MELQVESIKAELKQWVARTNGEIAAQDIHDDTELIEQRIITSVDIMNLILFMEHLQGKPVSVQNIQPGAFSSINAIIDAFFSEVPRE